jgi:rhodanese-related sulfurtransferase
MDSTTLIGVGVLVAVLVVGFLMMRGAGGSVPDGPPQPGAKVSGKQARELVAQGALLVDVRTPGEFRGGHIEGAINVPRHARGGRVGELGAKERAVVVYCQSGMRSRGAQEALVSKGFSQVYNLGGIGAW